MTQDASSAPGAAPKFDVLTDDGFDLYQDLMHDVPVVPFGLHFGEETFESNGMPLEELFRRLESGGPHPSTSQPNPEAFAVHYRQATRPLLVITLSSALSGSYNSAMQAKAMVPEADVTVHDAGTLSAAQSFQLHAALTARARGESIETALTWMKQVHEETELFFTLDTLTYLRRGGRIGRVAAALGGVLNVRPVVTVDKSTSAYETVGRARSWSKAREVIAQQSTKRFGAGTPLRVGLVQGFDAEDVNAVLGHLKAEHPIVWHGVAKVGSALAIHTGPKAVAYAVAPHDWPWDRT